MKTFQHLTSEPMSLLLLPGHHFVSAEISALHGAVVLTVLQMNRSLYLYFSVLILLQGLFLGLLSVLRTTQHFSKRDIVGASQEIDCTGACWLNARLKYFLPQQILSVFPHLIHQTSTEMDRRMEWCSRLLFHDSTDKRFAQLSAEL